MPKKTRDKGKSTFIEEARRQQIIESAVKTIAEKGFINTTLLDIAETANTSKGVVSYHFDSKDELIYTMLEFIVELQRENRKQFVDVQSSALGKISAHIRADFEFMKKYNACVVTLVELWGAFTSMKEKLYFENHVYIPGLTRLAELLKQGQLNGELSDFDPEKMAYSIQGCIDGIMIQWVFSQNQIDLEFCHQELVTMFENRIRKEKNN